MGRRREYLLKDIEQDSREGSYRYFGHSGVVALLTVEVESAMLVLFIRAAALC